MSNEQETQVTQTIDADVGDETQTEAESWSREHGWKPKESWRGNPEQWVDADTYYKRGQEMIPILKNTNKKLEGELAKLRADFDDKSKAIEEFREFHSKTEERAYNRALETLKAERKSAIDKGDGEKFEQVDKDIKELEASKPKPAEKKDGGNKPDPVLAGWMSENEWFGKNAKASAYAQGVADELRKSRPDLLGKREFLDEMTRITREEVPHLFEDGRRARPQSVEGGGAGGSVRKSKKTAADLPEEARKAGERFVRNKIYKSLEEYAADYHATNTDKAA